MTFFILQRGAAAYVPMAQAIQQYEKRIPDRFHLPSRQNLVKGVQEMAYI